MNGNNAMDNARVQITYSNGVVENNLPAQFLPDFDVDPFAAIFVSFEQANIRPYSWMEPVEVFEITGQGGVIPEPSTWTISALLVAAVGAWRFRTCKPRGLASAPEEGAEGTEKE
jgi:hypothetical protein